MWTTPCGMKASGPETMCGTTSWLKRSCSAANKHRDNKQRYGMNDYVVKEIELERIFNDAAFNCRGTIIPLDVVDLVRDIEKNGLQFPINVQPGRDSDTPLPDGCDFRVIAGHRRYAAFRVLKRTTIPAMIRTGLDPIKARLLNLGENLKRQELNICQEAFAIKNLRDLGLTQQQIADELNLSRTWVQVRLNLLSLPEQIQSEAAAGLLNQTQIRSIYAIPADADRFEAVRRIKTSRLRGEKSIDISDTTKNKPFRKKRQSSTSIIDMVEHIGKSVGYGLATRALAWSNGQISAAEFYFDIKRAAEAGGRTYNIPIMEND